MQQQREVDPFTIEIIQRSLVSICSEMFAAMRKTAMSAIIYEVLDMATGIVDVDGNLASSGAGIPLFIAGLDKAAQYVMAKCRKSGIPIEAGDVFVTNDPYHGGVTHLNDVIFLMPVFVDEELIAWTGDIAHWNDVGGMVPGSISTIATEIFQEGLRIPAVKLIARGELIQHVFDIIAVNSRMPDFLQGDLWAGIAAVRLGERRLKEIGAKYGKETLKIAMDRYLDYGEQITLSGLRRLPKGEFNHEEKHGIATISQELSPMPHMSVIENVFFGIEPRRAGVVQFRQMRRQYEDLISQWGFSLNAHAKVGALRTADIQKVEILRAVATDAQVIVMDEPTSSLTSVETSTLHRMIRALRERGKTIVYVSHFLDEVLDLADTVTVLRSGRLVRTAPATEETEESLVAGMFGAAAAAEHFEKRQHPSAPVVLDVSGLSRKGVLQ